MENIFVCLGNKTFKVVANLAATFLEYVKTKVIKDILQISINCSNIYGEGKSMPRTDKARSIRCEKLLQYLELNPLATDEVLAKEFNVSINTIRLDRARLGIKEFKERLKSKAEETMSKVTSISASEFVGDMINFTPGESAKSRLETSSSMTFEGMDVVRGEYIYSFAETIAISLIPTKAALVGVANIKYVEPIGANTVIYALAEVKRKTESGYIVWVRILDEKENLKFKGKFILKGIK